MPPSSKKRFGRFPNQKRVLVSKPRLIHPFCFALEPLLFLLSFPFRRKTAKMAVSANDLYPVVQDLSETEYSTISNTSRTIHSDGGDYRSRAESTLTTAHNFLASSLWCGNNDTTLSSNTQRMASLGHHRRHEHLSVPPSQSTSPYHPYYSPQQQRSPSPRTVTKQVVFAETKPNGHFRQLEDDYVLTQQVCTALNTRVCPHFCPYFTNHSLLSV